MKNKHNHFKNSLIASACFALAGIGTMLLSTTLKAAPQGNGSSSIFLSGVVRDFDPAAPDFVSLPVDGLGQYTGIIETTLGMDGKPVYKGTAYQVLTPATSVTGTPIAPTLSNAALTSGDFEIVNGQVVVYVDFNASFEVLGVDFSNIPITLLGRAGAVTYQPFGSYSDPDNGNINDSNNPRTFTYPTMYPAGTAITVSGRSWIDDTTIRLTADSGVNSQQVIVLRDGDPVPAIDPFPGQDPLDVYIADYVDAATNTISLLENQVIYLFELYTTDMGSIFADFQDMVILLSLGGTEAVATTPCSPIDDIDAVLDTTLSTGGVTSLDTFQTWFNDVLGVNMSLQFKIKLNRQADNTYLFDDTIDPNYQSGFYPLDGKGYGNEDNGPHNQFFTFQIDASFTYDASKSQFFTFASTMDVWVFINDQLVIDLGGIHNSLEQTIDLDRLCMLDGEDANISLFYAQRNVLSPHFSISTNVELTPTTRPLVYTSFYD
ncbi:MAG: fibro-slime domain-containing protein [Planctomycetes bacterium]|nr:fibro-slime domain-containing protein [Planctomycetota bacterium]